MKKLFIILFAGFLGAAQAQLTPLLIPVLPGGSLGPTQSQTQSVFDRARNLAPLIRPDWTMLDQQGAVGRAAASPTSRVVATAATPASVASGTTLGTPRPGPAIYAGTRIAGDVPPPSGSLQNLYPPAASAAALGNNFFAGFGAEVLSSCAGIRPFVLEDGSTLATSGTCAMIDAQRLIEFQHEWYAWERANAVESLEGSTAFRETFGERVRVGRMNGVPQAMAIVGTDGSRYLVRYVYATR